MSMYYPVSLDRLLNIFDPFYEAFSSTYVEQNLSTTVHSDSSEKKLSKAQQLKLKNSIEIKINTELQQALQNDNSLHGLYLSYLEDLDFQPIRRQEIKDYIISSIHTTNNKDDNTVNNTNKDDNTVNNTNNNDKADLKILASENNISSSKRQEHLSNIARIVTSYNEDHVISFNINDKNNNNNLNLYQDLYHNNNPYSYDFTTLEDLHAYIAMVYRNESIVYCLPREESVSATQALGIEFKDGDKMELANSPIKDRVNTVSWALSEDALEYTWKNPEFVLDKIKETKNIKYNNLDSIQFLSLVDPTLFKNNNFLKKACSNLWFAEFLISNNIRNVYEVVSLDPDNMDLITHLWNKISFNLPMSFAKPLAKHDIFNQKSLDNILLEATTSPQNLAAFKLTDDMLAYNNLDLFQPQEQMMYLYYIYDNIKKHIPDYENYDLPNFYTSHENYPHFDFFSLRVSMQETLYECYVKKYTEVWEKSQSTKDFFNQYVFNDQDKTLQFLKGVSYINHNILQLIPKNIIEQPEVSTLLLSNHEKFMANDNFQKNITLIPQSFYDSSDIKENINRKNAFINVLIDYCGHSQQIASIIKQYDWFNTKDGVVETLRNYIDYPTNINQQKSKTSNILNSDLENLYNALPSTIDKDIEVIKACLYVNKQFFKNLGKNLKSNPDIALYYLKMGGDMNFVDENILFSLTDTTLIASILQSDSNYRFLKDDNCPQDWLTNIDILLAVKNNIAQLTLSSEQLESIFLNKDFKTQQLTNALFQNNPEFYTKLPDRLKEDLGLTHSYIHSIKNLDHYSVKSIPTVMWAYHCVCLAAISKNEELAKHIPTEHWQDRKFLRTLFNQIDNNMINKKIIHQMPDEIRQCLTVFQIDSNFSAFFNSFTLQQDLENKIDNKPNNVKKKKI